MLWKTDGLILSIESIWNHLLRFLTSPHTRIPQSRSSYPGDLIDNNTSRNLTTGHPFRSHSSYFLIKSRCSILLLFAIFQFPLLCCGYGRPVVVQVDSRHFFDELDPDSHTGRQFTSLSINGNDLICGDAARGSTRLLNYTTPTLHYDNHEGLLNLNDKLSAVQSGPGQHWSSPHYEWTPESQLMRYLIASKMSLLMDQCFLYKSSFDAYWVYDICMGYITTDHYISYKLKIVKLIDHIILSLFLFRLLFLFFSVVQSVNIINLVSIAC